VALAGLLVACQATDGAAILARAEQNLEANRRQISRDASERREGFASMVSALSGCSLVERQAYELSPEQEELLGRAVVSRQLATLGVEPLSPSDPVARYVDQVGQYLALVAEAVGNANGPDRANGPERLLDNRPWPLAGYRFLVLPTEEPRATGGPGGTVMISTGFLRTLESEEELAVVLAHEVAHVQRGHGVEAIKAFLCNDEARQESSSSSSRRVLGQRGKPLPGAVPEGTGGVQEEGKPDELLGRTAEQVANLYRDGFPQDFELEADRISVRILLAAGYDGRAFPGLLRRMSREAPAQHVWLRMHPPTADRLSTVGERLRTLGTAQAWPSAEAIAPRTKRFQEAMELLNQALGQGQ
jgi:predicted Zn-dependent protease